MADNKDFNLAQLKIGSISTGRGGTNKAKKDERQDSNEKKKTSFNIPMFIYRDLRKLAAQEDRKVGDIVEEALLDILKKYEV